MGNKAVGLVVMALSVLAAAVLLSPIGRGPVVHPPLRPDEKPDPLPKTHDNEYYSVTLKWVRPAKGSPPYPMEKTDGPSTEWHREPIADPSTAELPVAEACFEVVSHCDSTHELSLTDIRLLDSSGHTIPNALLQRQALPSGTVYAWFHGPAPDDPIWRFYAAVQCVDPASGRAHVTGGMLFIVEAPPTASEAPAPASALRAEGPAAAPRGEMEGGDDG